LETPSPGQVGGTDHYQWTSPATATMSGSVVIPVQLPISPIAAPLSGSTAGSLMVYASSTTGDIKFSLPVAGNWKVTARGVCRTLVPGNVAAYGNGVSGVTNIGSVGEVPLTLLLDDTTGVTYGQKLENYTGTGLTQEWESTLYFTTTTSGAIVDWTGMGWPVSLTSGTYPATFGIGHDVFITRLPDAITAPKKKIELDETEMMKLFDKWSSIKDKASACSTPVMVGQDAKGVVTKWDGLRANALPEIGAKPFVSYFEQPRRAKSLERDEKSDNKNQTKKDEKGKG